MDTNWPKLLRPGHRLCFLELTRRARNEIHGQGRCGVDWTTGAASGDDLCPDRNRADFVHVIYESKRILTRSRVQGLDG